MTIHSIEAKANRPTLRYARVTLCNTVHTSAEKSYCRALILALGCSVIEPPLGPGRLLPLFGLFLLLIHRMSHTRVRDRFCNNGL
jgi:hypothetical protein